jgi:hypothetical protein
MHIIPALRKLRQEDHRFEASLSYRARCCRNKQTTMKVYMGLNKESAGCISQSAFYHCDKIPEIIDL